MFVNENNVVCNIKDIHLIINTENGAVVGVDDESLKQYQGISKERTFKITNRELYNFLLENNFISDNQFKYKDNSILTAYFHVTNHCNLHCLGCYSDSIARNKERDLSIESMLKILDELKTVGVQNIIISGGEPLIRKDIVDIVKYAKESCNMQRMILITNGTIGDWKLFKELALYLDTISVSIDTYSSECSAFLRDEGIFEKIILNIKQMRENGLNVSILPTIHHKNVKEMSKYIKLAESLGTEISFSIFTTGQEKIYKDYILSQKDLIEIAKHFMNYGMTVNDVPINNTMEGKRHCGTGCSMISIGADGSIYPCHMLMEESFKMGNLVNNSLLEIRNESKKKKCDWEGDVTEIDGCRQCEFRFLCGGGCRARAYLTESNIRSKDPFCIMYKNFYEEMFISLKENIGR